MMTRSQCKTGTTSKRRPWRLPEVASDARFSLVIGCLIRRNMTSSTRETSWKCSTLRLVVESAQWKWGRLNANWTANKTGKSVQKLRRRLCRGNLEREAHKTLGTRGEWYDSYAPHSFNVQFNCRKPVERRVLDLLSFLLSGFSKKKNRFLLQTLLFTTLFTANI